MSFTINRDRCATAVVLALTLIQTCCAVQIFSNTTVPTNLTTTCSKALLGDIKCSPVVVALQAGSYYPESTLKSVCTADCANSLAAYETTVGVACTGQTWSGYHDTLMPLVIIADMLLYHFNLTCLMDSGRYCNIVASQAALAQDPANNALTGGVFGPANGTTNPTDPCDLCFIKNLQFQASSPYFDGPLLADRSIYQSKTSSCGITGHPLTTSDLTFYKPTTPPVASPIPCSGMTYTIKPTDDCHSISISEGIGTAWLLMDNNLQAYCAQFPTSGSLCLVNKCNIYTLQVNDTCESVAKANNITVSQFKAWNPTINAGCFNLDRVIGHQLCVSSPGKAYIPPTVTALAPSTAATAAPAPTNIAVGTNTNCGRYYAIVTGDYCNMVLIKFGISLDDFVFLNPAINANCTNLLAFESYCVQAVGDINTYSGRPVHTTAAPTGVQTTANFSLLSDATYTTPTGTVTPTPLAPGTRSDCYHYFPGDLFQKGVGGTNWKSQCQLAASIYQVDLVDFGTWNAGLGNVSLANCRFSKGALYCGKLYFGEAPPPPPPTSSLPIRPGTSPNCTEYVDVTVADGWTCQDILTTYALTIAQFFSYNPAVGSDCSGLWLKILNFVRTDYQYCIRTPDYIDPTLPTSTARSPTTPFKGTSTAAGSLKPTSPVQPGQPPNCNKWYTVQPGDSCATVENTYFLTSAQFLQWNPAISSDCTTGFWASYAYCVGTTDATLTRGTATTMASTTTIRSSVPTPTQQNNAISNCNKYAIANTGDFCSAFATRNGITLDQLYAWNSVLGPSGKGCATAFWSGYYYCVGVAG